MNQLPYPQMTASSKTDPALYEVRRYLFRLVEELNNSFDVISAGNYVSAPGGASEGGLSAKAKEQVAEQTEELKTLIVKNAHDVRSEIDLLENTMSSSYVARSEFGTFAEQINTRFTQTADALEQQIDATSVILDKYLSNTSGYIRQGIVRYDGLVPIIGIAIGQDVTVTGEKQTVNGVEYEVIDTSHNMSVFTSGKLSFYINGAEVAYFANNTLTVNSIETGDIKLNGEWSVETSNGLSFKWIGGNA